MVARDRPIAAGTPRGSACIKRDPGRFDRDIRAGPDGDADVGPRQRRSIVDPVAHHRDRPTAALETLDDGRLVLGPGVPDDAVGGDPHLAPDGMGRRPRASPVTSQTSMPALASSRTAAADSARTGSVIAMTPAARPSIATNAVVLPARRRRRSRPASGSGSTPSATSQRDAADRHVARPVGRVRPFRGHRPRRRPRCRATVRKPSSRSFAYATIAAPERVLARSLERRDQVDRASVRSPPGGGHDLADRRAAESQRPGLVEDDGVDPPQHVRARRRHG